VRPFSHKSGLHQRLVGQQAKDAVSKGRVELKLGGKNCQRVAPSLSLSLQYAGIVKIWAKFFNFHGALMW